MKIGVVLEAEAIESLIARALAVEGAGVDFAWLPSRAGTDTALLAAAAVAARTSVLRLATCAPVGGHPLAIAEGAVVADNCSNGRLVLVLEDRESDRELLAETVDVVIAALSARPFRHAGKRWLIPANLPENDQHEEMIVVTPYAVQPELPVWLSGPVAVDVARPRALSHVASEADRTETLRATWAETEASIGIAARRLRRPAVRLVEPDESGEFDVARLVEQLRADQRGWGLDAVALRLPASLDDNAWTHAVHRIAVQVRARVTMHELPEGLDQHWRDVLS